MALLVPVVIGQSDYFGFGFSTVIWKPLYYAKHETHLICPVFSPRCDKTASLFWGKTLIIVFNAMQHSPVQQNNEQQLHQ